MKTRIIITAILMFGLPLVIHAQASGNPIQPLVTSYLELKNALFSSDVKTAKIAATQLKQELSKINPDSLHKDEKGQLQKLAENIDRIINSSDLVKQRNYFMAVSESFYQLLKIDGGNSEILYYDFCPMANNGKGAYWISETEKIKNPYYGSKMATCGSVKDSLPPVK